jgi:hypothetical protein
MSALVHTALALAAKGKTVFPCWPGRKEPLTPRGFKDAAADPGRIRAWWARHPEANLAITTGEQSGVIVLDVDVDPEKGKDGEAALTPLLEKYGSMPVTLTVRTPRGGRRLYFKHPGAGVRVPCSTDKLGNGLDVRGDGGYVLVPPSRTERGEYLWEAKYPPAEMPKWLLDLMTGLAPRETGSTPSGSVAGNGNNDEEHRIRDALRQIPAGLPHDDWVRIMMALHSWDPSRGKVLAQDWSTTCPEKFRDSDFEAAWRSFKPNGGVTLGTLFETARRHGWVPSPSRTKQMQSPRHGENEVAELVMSKWPNPPRPEAFYGVMGEFVRRLEPHTEADPMAILMQTLVGFGNLISRTAFFEVEADRHYCNVNVVIVGNSSKARKGTSWGHVVRLLRKVDPSWPKPITGLSTGEGLIYCVRDPVTKTDRDGKEEIIDAGVADKRLLAVESEFGRTLQCMNREGNTLSAVIRQAFDSGDLRVATKSSPHVATGAHISIIGHITVIELNQLLTVSDSANGLANRFPWVAVRRSKLLPEGGKASALDLSDLVERLKRAVEFAKTPQCVFKDQEAVELWREIYARLSQERPGLLGAVISRAEALVMRLALIFAVVDCSPTIRVAHLQAALAIWEYCEASAAFIFGDSLGNPLAERVLEIMRGAGESGLGLGGLYEALRGHVEREALHAALRQLHSQGLARFEKVKTSGRPGQIWFATQAACEKSERSAKKVEEAEPPASAPPGDLSSLNSLKSPPAAWEETI